MTNSSVLSPESLAASFLYGTLPKIMGRPTFMNIFSAFKLQQVNAAEIRTTNGGGAHGYLGAILDAATYATITPTAWVTPVFPGTYAAVPDGATGAQIRVITEQHTEALREFQQHNNVQQALKKQIIDSIDMAYLEGYKQPYVQFGNRTIAGFYTWLFQQYGTLSPKDNDANNAKFYQEWDPSMPFEAYAAILEESAEIARLNGTPFTNEQKLATAVAKVYNTALYFDALREWKRKADADRTWPNFKTHMAAAQTELTDEQATAQRSGFGNHQTANAAQQQLEATQAQLLAAQEMLTNLLTATKAGNTADNNNDTRLNDITNLLKQQANELKQVKGAMTSLKTTGANRTKNTRQPADPNGYCWSHGYKVAPGHNSGTCSCKLTDPNHKTEATRENNMGGSQKNKDWKPTP